MQIYYRRRWGEVCYIDVCRVDSDGVARAKGMVFTSM